MYCILCIHSLRKHPFLLALRRWERFARRNVCDSATKIPYWWRKICPESGQKRWLVEKIILHNYTRITPEKKMFLRAKRPQRRRARRNGCFRRLLYSRHSYSLLFFQTVILFRRYHKLTWTLRSSYWNSLKCVRAFQIELEFESVGLLGEGNTAVFGEELLVVRERASKELNPHFALTPRFETGLHWKKVGTLTTTPLQISPPF